MVVVAETVLLDDAESIVGGCKYIPLCFFFEGRPSWLHPSVLARNGYVNRESQAENGVFTSAEQEGG